MLKEHQSILDLIINIDAKKIVEIGVWKGDCTEQILKYIDVEEYIGIDPYVSVDINGYHLAPTDDKCGRVYTSNVLNEQKCFHSLG